MRSAALAVTVALATVTATAVPLAQGAVVTLRVESSESTLPLFDGTVSTQPHAVDGNDGSGAHPCGGPPGETPAPTATGALDDGLREAGISWRGNWDPSFRDFFVDRIGPYASAAPDRYWSLTVNGRFAGGGCLTRVADGDSIRFFYGPLSGTGLQEVPAGGGPAKEGPTPGGVAHGHRSGPPAKRVRRLASAAAGYLRHHQGVGEDWARLALAVHAGRSPAPAATKLLGERLGSRSKDGSIGEDVNATALAVIALAKSRPRAAGRAASWLATKQSPDGGFGYRPGVSPDADTTGLASWALAVARRGAATRRAGAFVRSAQAPDGGFPSLPGGASNSQSTGLAAIALRVSGIGPGWAGSASGRGPLDYLSALARRDGSIAYDRGGSPTPVWTTAQALLGLTSKAKLLALGGD